MGSLHPTPSSTITASSSNPSSSTTTPSLKTHPSTRPLTRASVAAAHTLIKPHIHQTPVLTCSYLDALASQPQTAATLLADARFRQQQQEGTSTDSKGSSSSSSSSSVRPPPARPQMRFFFKCENLQKVGAFKIRGATHALARLKEEEEKDDDEDRDENGDKKKEGRGKGGRLREKGVLTHSSGNHAQALAKASRAFGVPAHIVMPAISTPSKIAATQSYGAHVYFSGSTSQEREAVTIQIQRDTGATFVPPYEHPDIILGQGTMALELEQQVRDLVQETPSLSVHHAFPAPVTAEGTPPPQLQEYHLDAVIAPLGGGGMLSGIATALHPTRTQVYGAEPSHEGADDGRRGLLADPPARIPHVRSLTIADGLRTPLGELNWNVVSDKKYVRGVYSVSDVQIKRAMRLVLERMKLVVEPSGLVGLAVALYDEDFRRTVEEEGGAWDIGIVFSGGNVSVDGLVALFAEETEEKMKRKQQQAEEAGQKKTEGQGNGQHKAAEEVNLKEREVGQVSFDGEKKAEDIPG